jgi:4-diphosphocytidyl-2-C-methyl-D-erythritol kinase
MERAYALPAPAKINLFLHVLGRCADGYHDLQSVLALIDLADLVDIERRDDGVVRRSGDLIGPPESDLALSAALLLQQRTACRHGAEIHISKLIPAGAGLGGGSSDAATTLIALNRIWGLGLDRKQLAVLALELGADVPFFVHGFNAFAEGRGERLTPVSLPPSHYGLIWPQVHVSTKEIFQDPGLTRNTKATKMADFAAAAERAAGAVVGTLFGSNDLEPVARRHYPQIDRACAHLAQFGPARMTGSGSAVFVAVPDVQTARLATAELESGWQGWAVQGLPEHPLHAW